MGLGAGTFFRKGRYGSDVLVTGGRLANSTDAFLARTPLPPAVRADLARLYRGTTDYGLAGPPVRAGEAVVTIGVAGGGAEVAVSAAAACPLQPAS